MTDFYAVYDALLSGIHGHDVITAAAAGSFWTCVETADRFGMAMTTEGSSIPPMLSDHLIGTELQQLAKAVVSWNFREAGFGMAAVNGFYNTPERLAQLRAAAAFDRYCTDGLELSGKRIGVVGHLNMPDFIREQAAEVLILERNPRPGDYPDSACDVILPTCDIVLITGSALTNKTLPHLLECCPQACTILTGPSVPLCPALLELGLDRLAGLVVTEPAAMADRVLRNLAGPPYDMGQSFLLCR